MDIRDQAHFLEVMVLDESELCLPATLQGITQHISYDSILPS